MKLNEFAVLFLICLIWGLHFVVMKVTVDGIAPPIFYAAVRMTIVAILLLPFLRWYKGLMPKVLAAGLCYGALNYAFMFPGLKMTTASAAAIAIELYVPFSIILAVIFFRERIGLPRIAGILLAIIGVALIALARPSEDAGPLFVYGLLLVTLAALAEAIGANLVKSIKGISGIRLLAWFAIVGAVVLWPLSLIFEDNYASTFSDENRMMFFMALTYSALLVSIVAHSSYYWLLQRLPMAIVATSGLMTTVIAVTASVIILGETLTPIMALGAIMTLAGVGLILMRQAQVQSKKKKPILPRRGKS